MKHTSLFPTLGLYLRPQCHCNPPPSWAHREEASLSLVAYMWSRWWLSAAAPLVATGAAERASRNRLVFPLPVSPSTSTGWPLPIRELTR